MYYLSNISWNVKLKKLYIYRIFLLTGGGFPMQGCFHHIEPRPSTVPFPLIIKPFTNEKPIHVFIGDPEYSDFVLGATIFPESWVHKGT